MREVMKADGLSAVVVWMSVLSFFFVVILSAMFASISGHVDRISKRLDRLEKKLSERQDS